MPGENAANPAVRKVRRRQAMVQTGKPVECDGKLIGSDGELS
jgi:hypothetical protein